MTQCENILTTILNCGTADFSILEDINYDLGDIIDECVADGCLSLENICIRVFQQGANDLQEAFDRDKEDIRNDILYHMESIKEDLAEEATEEEIEDFDEYQDLVADLKLLDSGKLQPVDDLDIYFNYLDTHVYMRHIDFYRKWMENTVDDIEDNMGFVFLNNNWN